MLRLRALFLLAIAVLILQGCGKDGAPSVDMVPATADYVAIINADSLQEAVESLFPGQRAEDMARLGQCCDLQRVLVFKPVESRQPMAVVEVTDTKELTSLLADMGWRARKSDGEEAYAPDEGGEFAPCVVIDGNSAWFLGTRSDLKNRRESLSQAKKENFGKYALEFNLDGTTRLVAYASPAFLGFSDPDAMIKVTGSIDADRTLTVKASFVSVAEGSAGETIPITALAPITDTRFAEYLPRTNSFVAAAGIKKGFNWNGLVDMLGSGLGTQNQGMLQSLLPYMASLNGPFAIGIGPLTAQSLTSDELESQSIVIYATLEGTKAAEAVEEINGNLRDKGLSPRPRADGIYAFDLNGVKYRYHATDDGIFIFALNREPQSGQHPAPDIFSGHQAVAQLQLPPLSAILPGNTSTMQIQASLTVEPDGLILTIKSGDTLPIVALSRYFTQLDNAMQAEAENAPDYYDYY